MQQSLQKQTGFWLSFYSEWSKSLLFSLKIPCKAKADPATTRPSLFYWGIGVKSQIQVNKWLHYTPLVLLIVLLLVCSPLSYIQIKSHFASSVNAHFVSNYPTLSPLRPNTTIGFLWKFRDLDIVAKMPYLNQGSSHKRCA